MEYSLSLYIYIWKKRSVQWRAVDRNHGRGPSALRRINPKDRVVLSILSSRIPAASDRGKERGMGGEKAESQQANIGSVDPFVKFTLNVKRWRGGFPSSVSAWMAEYPDLVGLEGNVTVRTARTYLAKRIRSVFFLSAKG